MNNTANIVVLNKRDESLNTCRACMKRLACPVAGMEDAHAQVHRKTLQPGEDLIKAGDTFDGLYMVRSGFFKSSFIDTAGDMQVTGFHFPGEIFGIDGMDRGTYGDTVTALDTGGVCRIPFSLFAGKHAASSQAESGGDRMLSLVRMMSAAISRDRNMIFNLGKLDSRRRFAAFLLDVADRMQSSGYSRDAFRLCMSRTDIANHLCLAIETVSRLFSQFNNMGIIDVARRELVIRDRGGMQALADGCYEEGVPLEKAG